MHSFRGWAAVSGNSDGRSVEKNYDSVEMKLMLNEGRNRMIT
ncbi:MAG: hypothetical protein ACTS46_00580 [Candidatus Hodgkinia cicadicola]